MFETLKTVKAVADTTRKIVVTYYTIKLCANLYKSFTGGSKKESKKDNRSHSKRNREEEILTCFVD